MGKKNKDQAVYIIIAIIGITVLSKLLGFVRDAVLSGRYETAVSDAYFMGLNITTIVFLALGTAISTVIIPIAVKAEKEKDRDHIISSIFNSVLLISLIVGIVYLLFTPEILKIFAGGFTGEKLDLTIQLTRVMTPTVFFICIAYLYVGLLQANEHYLLPTIISIPYNLIILFYLFLASNTYGVMGLAFVTLIGWFAQMIMQVPTVNKVVHFKYALQLDLKNHYVKEFLIGLLPIVFVTATQQINVLIDNQFISHFGDGGVSAFYYANMLFTAIVTTAVYGITAVMFPKFNKRFVELDKKFFFSTISTVLQGIIILLLPVSIGLILVSENVIAIIFMRGSFTYLDVQNTALLLNGYSSFMLAFGIWDVLNKAFYTMGNRKMPVFISAFIILSNLVLNQILVGPLGLMGIPIGTSIAFYIGILISLWLFKSEDGSLAYSPIGICFIKALFAVAMMAISILAANHVLEPRLHEEVFANRMILVGIDVILGVLIYFLTLFFVRERTIMEFINKYKKKNKKGNIAHE